MLVGRHGDFSRFNIEVHGAAKVPSDHFAVEDGDIDRTESGLRFIGKAETSVDIFSVGLRTRFGGPAPEPAPMK